MADPATLEQRKKDREKYILQKRENETIYKHFGELVGCDFKIRNNKNCEINILDSTTGMYIDNCEDCKIVCGPIDGSIFIRGSKNCEISLIARQVRFRDCENIKIFTYCPSDPAVESSFNIYFAPFNAYFPHLKELFLKTGFDPNEQNHINTPYDFTVDKVMGDGAPHFLSLPKEEFYLKIVRDGNDGLQEMYDGYSQKEEWIKERENEVPDLTEGNKVMLNEVITSGNENKNDGFDFVSDVHLGKETENNNGDMFNMNVGGDNNNNQNNNNFMNMDDFLTDNNKNVGGDNNNQNNQNNNFMNMDDFLADNSKKADTSNNLNAQNNQNNDNFMNMDDFLTDNNKNVGSDNNMNVQSNQKNNNDNFMNMNDFFSGPSSNDNKNNFNKNNFNNNDFNNNNFNNNNFNNNNFNNDMFNNLNKGIDDEEAKRIEMRNKEKAMRQAKINEKIEKEAKLRNEIRMKATEYMKQFFMERQKKIAENHQKILNQQSNNSNNKSSGNDPWSAVQSSMDKNSPAERMREAIMNKNKGS